MTDGAAPPKDMRFFIRLGYGAVAAIFGGVLFWSVVAPIHGAVIAPGHIVVETSRKTVQHLDGGVVQEILVREGDQVRAGDLLVQMDDTEPAAALALLDGQLTELYARRARLEAERDGADKISEAQGLGDIISSPAMEAKIAGQRQLFEARRQTKATQIGLIEERIVQQNERIIGLEAQIKSLRDQRKLILDELGAVRELYQQGFAPLTQVRALERESKKLEGEGGALKAGVAEATSIIAEGRLEIERLKQAGREDAISELRDVEVSIAEREERRVAAADALERTQVRAPQAGRVLGLSIHTVGGVVSTGQLLMSIVPVGDRLQIAARVTPRDVDKVRAGQETLVRFSALGGRMTPEARGIVNTISADSFVDEATGGAYYLVLVDIPQGTDLEHVLNGELLVPGMPAEAFIRTASRPAISYFLKPLTDALARSMRDE